MTLNAWRSASRRKSRRGAVVVPLPAQGPVRAAAPARAPARRRVRFDPYRLVMTLALVYFLVTLVSQQLVIIDLNRQLAELESEIDTVRAEQVALRERIAYLQTDAYIIQEARGRFGLTHPGEIRYVTVEGDDATVSTEAGDP